MLDDWLIQRCAFNWTNVTTYNEFVFNVSKNLKMCQPLNILLIVFTLLLKDIDYCHSDLKTIKDFLKEYNKEGDELQRNDTLASWKYEIDMTKESKDETVKWSGITSKFAIENRKKAKSLLKDLDDDGDIPKSLMRQLMLIKRTASSSNQADNKELTDLESKMTSIYSKTVVRNLHLHLHLHLFLYAHAHAHAQHVCMHIHMHLHLNLDLHVHTQHTHTSASASRSACTYTTYAYICICICIYAHARGKGWSWGTFLRSIISSSLASSLP